MKQANYIVQPVYKALRVLDALGQEKSALSLKEVCLRVALPKTTVYRYLCTLCAAGLAVYDTETDQYRLGVRIWELGQRVGEQLPVRPLALPWMEALRERFNETVNLGILDGKDIVYIEMVESQHALRMQARLGSRDPAYTTALGKAILAFLPEKQWEQHLPARLVARTNHTLTSKSTFATELQATRERGYSLDQGENENGALCIGAPIRDQRGTVVAALSLSAPASRIAPPLQAQMAAAVMESAVAISQRLGHS